MSCKIAPECAQAVADVRSDATDTDFAVLHYTSKTSIGLAASGAGGLDAAKAHFPANDVAYALIRKKFNWETVGCVTADTIKFVFVYWRPEQIPVARKMKPVKILQRTFVD